MFSNLAWKIHGILGVADFKNGAQVAGVVGEGVPLENIPGVVVGDVVVFDFAGVVGKVDDLPIQYGF